MVGAALSFSPARSWHCGHGAAFRAPTSRSLVSATRTWLYGRSSLAMRTAVRMAAGALARSPPRTASVFGLSAKASPITKQAASMSPGARGRMATGSTTGPPFERIGSQSPRRARGALSHLAHRFNNQLEHGEREGSAECWSSSSFLLLRSLQGVFCAIPRHPSVHEALGAPAVGSQEGAHSGVGMSAEVGWFEGFVAAEEHGFVEWGGHDQPVEVAGRE